MSGKRLQLSLTVQAALVADRVDITSYRVIVGPPIQVEVTYTCGRTEADGSITPLAEKQRIFDGADVTTAMIQATGAINEPMLGAALAAGLLTADQVTAMTALAASHPDLLATAYYNGTRDALYSLL
jgi:hypothetical protein